LSLKIVRQALLPRLRSRQFVQLAGTAGSLRIKTRNQGVARPQVEEKSGLPEAFTAHFQITEDWRFGTGMPGHIETSCRRSIPTGKGFSLFGFAHGHTKKYSNSVGKRSSNLCQGKSAS
jgi:hypothetical protein